MGSNLRSAQQAIKAELAHALKGMDFYTSRVEALQTALDQLEQVGSVETSTAKGKRGKAAQQERAAPVRARKAPVATKRGAKKSAASKKGSSGLPPTGGDFWLNLITAEPQSAAEISHAAIAALGIPLNKDQVVKLKQRATPTLNTLVAAQKIRDTGSGRERRFFKTTH